MTYTHIYNPAALVEFKDAVAWYKERSEIASLNFVTEVKEKIAAICSDPLRYRNTYKHYRETSLKKFPYYIIYHVDELNQRIIITSIYHHKRNPKNKFRK
jgi:plasmid stabilization system protein ParE